MTVVDERRFDRQEREREERERQRERKRNGTGKERGRMDGGERTEGMVKK